MVNAIDQDATGGLWKSRWFLPGTLGIAALAEFLFNRLAPPVMTALGGGSSLTSGIEVAGRFSLNLATVLGIMVVAGLLWRATLVGPDMAGVASRPMGRVSALMMGSLLCGLASMLVLAPRGLSAVLELKRAQWLMQLAGVCLALLTVLGILAQPVQTTSRWARYRQRRYKLGALLLILPPLLLLEMQWGLFTGIRALQRYGLLTLIYGPVLSVAALGMGAMFLMKLPPRPRGFFPGASALLTTVVMMLMLRRFPNLAIRIIYMSFDLRLPPHIEAYALYLLSLFAWVFAVVALLVGEKAERPRGLGLLLIGLAGCQSRALHQMLFYLAGLLCIAESLLLYRPESIPAALRRARAQTAAAASMPNSAA